MSAIENVNDWKRRTIVGASIGHDQLPAWLTDAYTAFRTNIVDKMYPCFFGSEAERNGTLYYSYVSDAQIDHLPTTLRTFLSVCVDISRDKNNLVIFFEPDSTPAAHSRHRAAFWNTLQYLRDHDPVSKHASDEVDPSDPNWEFPFAGRQFFVVGISPSYRLHRSRNLGPCMIMVFQPREVFRDASTGEEISTTVREVIRNRVRLWDGIGAHPDLCTYGHPGNREWTQYFVSDDNSPETGNCPLSRERGASDSADGREDTRTGESKAR